MKTLKNIRIRSAFQKLLKKVRQKLLKKVRQKLLKKVRQNNKFNQQSFCLTFFKSCS